MKTTKVHITTGNGHGTQNKQRIINPNNIKVRDCKSLTTGDLDPTLVKAIIMQESAMGNGPSRAPNDASSDIMQANVWYNPSSNDWSDSKKQFGLKQKGGATPYQSVHAGIGILFQKGMRTIGNTTTFRGWSNATDRYNGGGVPNYGTKVRSMVNSSIRPQ